MIGTATSTTGIKRRSNWRSIKHVLNNVLFYVFLFNTIFIPNDTFNLKIISFGMLLVLNCGMILCTKTKLDRAIVCFGAVLTTYNILFSALMTRNFIANLMRGYPGYILLLYPVIKRDIPNFFKVFMNMLKLLAVVTVVMAVLDFTNILEMYDNSLLVWYNHSANAMVGKGDELPLGYMIFFKTSPLLFVCLLDCLKNRKYIFVIITAVAIFLSGTRANIIMTLIAVVVYFCFLHPKRKVRYWAIILTGLAAVIILIDGRVIEFFADMFERKGVSDAIRTGHLDGIFAYWKASPLRMFIGSGYSAEFYSFGTNEMTSNIELSYWNLLRQVGLIPFCLMMIMYLYPIVYLLKRKSGHAYVLAYIIYLIISYTNPFLYSSTGILMLLFMFHCCGLVQETYKKCKGDMRRNERNNFSRRKRHKALPVDKGNK